MYEQFAIRSLLEKDLKKKKAKNPKYSLNAYAKQLGVSGATLSEILSGKRVVTQKNAERILGRFGIPASEKNRILRQFSKPGNASRTKSKNLKSVAERPLTLLKEDQFEIISSWHYFAILSLMETVDFQSDAQWIAHRLSLEESVVNTSLERLVRIGAIDTSKAGNWTLLGFQYATSDEIPSATLRALHCQNLELAKRSLENVPMEQRDFLAVTLSMDPSKLPEMKRMLREFLRTLMEYGEDGSKTEVFKICMQTFPLTRN